MIPCDGGTGNAAAPSLISPEAVKAKFSLTFWRIFHIIVDES